ncbi:hypothetical protein H0H81_011379 [Sphagnurus paluster]|uniref:Uncharacterized protein n=1 Tax=Sphagnurus paluster TaxID=117069 RepID=A0A9P7KKK1_9AGAR|nr:hypothetical protein H0H81_011379 [Sphagnurus paluster]
MNEKEFPHLLHLTPDPEMIATIHQLTSHYMMRSTLPFSLGKDEATYVEYGFARFADASTCTVRADEPLVLLAAAQWTEVHYRSSYKLFAKQIHLHEPSSNGFENFLALCISKAFAGAGGRRLNEVFAFSAPMGSRPPAWAKQHAELVGLYRAEGGPGATVEVGTVDVAGPAPASPAVTLGVNAKSAGETVAWLAHALHAPVCFPHASMGPDLLFLLRTLDDGRLVWVALQAKYSTGKDGTLSRYFLRKAIRSVTPSKFFVDKDGKPFSPAANPGLVTRTLELLEGLPDRRDDAGKYSLLRVVASFPAETNLKRCMEEDPDADGHPIACLSMKFIKQFTKGFSPVDFLENMENKAIGRGRITGKRTREANAPGPSRRKRLKI